VTGHVLYLQQNLDDQTQIVNGWLILPTGPRSFVVLTLMTTGDDFTRLHAVFDASFGTIRLASQIEKVEAKATRFDRARAILAGLDPDALRSLAGPRHWYRIYKPGAGGRPADDTEVGFMSMESKIAERGELTPERSERSFGAMEGETGLMVVLEARAILDAATSRYLDVDGRYWMSLDRATEAWSVRSTERIGTAERTSAETGVRTQRNLDVIHSKREQLTRDPTNWTLPLGPYLNQAEVFLLGRLLPRDGSVDGPLGFYYYDSGRKRLTERVDRWRRQGSGWELVTTPILQTASIRQIFDQQGQRLRRIDGDGTVTELIDPNDLRKLWQSKGLLAR
jgi:hypothetical protein